MARRTVTVDPQFPRRLRELRENAGWSLRDLAATSNYSRSFLWDLEAGNKMPTGDTAARLDAALDAQGDLSRLVRPADAPTRAAGRPGARFDAAAYLAPALHALTSPLDRPPAGQGTRLVGLPDVETVLQMTATLRGLDNLYGGGHVYPTAARFLDGEVAPLLAGRYDTGTGAALFAAAAEATQLTGWAAYDWGLHDIAQRHLIDALALSTAAADAPLAAEVIAAMSHQCGYLGAAAEAVDLSRAAAQLATVAGIDAIRAETAVLEAHGHALAGDEQACASALDQAERTLDRADRAGDPRWIGFFDEAYLAARFGHCFNALGRGDLALRFARRSLDMDGRYVRGRQFNLALAAQACVRVGEIEEACALGTEAVDAAGGLKSARAADYITQLAERLAPHAGVGPVREFTEKAEPILRAPAAR